MSLVFEGVDAADAVGVGGVDDRLHVVVAHAVEGDDAGLGEVGGDAVVDVTGDEDDVDAGVDERLGVALELGLLGLDGRVELVDAGDVVLGVDVALAYLQVGVDDADCCILDRAGHVLVDGLFLDDDAPSMRSVAGGGGTGLGPDDDVVADDSVVAVGVSDGVDDRLRERPRGDVAGALAGHGGLGDLPEHLVVDVVVEDLLIDGFLGEFGGLGSSPRRWWSRGRRPRAGPRPSRGARPVSTDAVVAVADLVLLGLGNFDDHLGGGVLNVHLLEDSRAVVRDDDVARIGDEHLVHATGAQCRPDGLTDGLSGGDVRTLCVLPVRPLGVLVENEEGWPPMRR